MSSKKILHALRTVSTERTPCVRCACGRIHFGSEHKNYEEYVSRSKHPQNETYVEQQNKTVAWFLYQEENPIDRSKIVIGCPCGRAEYIAKSIWSNRELILSFLQKMDHLLSDTASLDIQEMPPEEPSVEA